MPDKETALLAIPEISMDKIITLYYSSLFTGHQGVIETYLYYWRQILYTRPYALFVFIH